MKKGNEKERNKVFSIIVVAVGGVFLPVYLISWLVFKTAVLRENKSAVMDSKWVKILLAKAGNIIRMIKNGRMEENEGQERGKSFSDFEEEMTKGKEWFFSQDRERITITSYDGLKLIAYFLPAKEKTDKIMILMHGYRNDGFGDFSGLVNFYHDLGYHILAPHQRSHGESEGEYICYGVKERYDVKQWAEYIADRFGELSKIFLAGISMGGASVLMASGLKLPKQVKGIIADCAFTSPFEIFSHVMKSECQLPKFPFLYIADFICREKAGFGFKECNTIKCLKENKIPVLFIHGGKDNFVPTEMSYRNYEACIAPKKLLIVNGAAHGTSHLVDRGAYRCVVSEFINKWGES